MKKIPWFLPGGATPIAAWQANDKWSFYENTELTRMSEGGFEMLAFFPFVLSAEQVAIVIDLQNNGNFVKGRYETWEEFCKIHSIDTN